MSDKKRPLQPPTKPKPDVEHHLKEWSSGKRGGGKVPEDYGWRSNPKQYQEEHGHTGKKK